MAWYDIFYKVFNLKDRTIEHNNFNSNNFNKNNPGDRENKNFYQNIPGNERNKNICKSGDESIIKEHGEGGFGVGDIDSYMERPGIRKKLESVMETDWWKRIDHPITNK